MVGWGIILSDVDPRSVSVCNLFICLIMYLTSIRVKNLISEAFFKSQFRSAGGNVFV